MNNESRIAPKPFVFKFVLAWRMTNGPITGSHYTANLRRSRTDIPDAHETRPPGLLGSARKPPRACLALTMNALHLLSITPVAHLLHQPEPGQPFVPDAVKVGEGPIHGLREPRVATTSFSSAYQFGIALWRARPTAPRANHEHRASNRRTRSAKSASGDCVSAIRLKSTESTGDPRRMASIDVLTTRMASHVLSASPESKIHSPL